MRKIIPLVAAGATALALGGGSLAWAGLQHDVTLSVDGQAAEVSTTGRTVADLLEARDVVVGEHDVVAPGLGSRLTDGTRVAVQYGRQVTFTVDGVPQTVWTTATDVDSALSTLGLDTAGADLSTSRSAPIGRQGLDVAVATPKTVVLTTGGKKRELTTTAATVGALLDEAKVPVDDDDELSVPASTRLTDGTKVRHTRVDVHQASKKTSVDFRVVRHSSSKLERGSTRVEAAGRAGSRTTTYRVTEHDGREVERTKTGSSVTRKPVDRVVLVGTKAPAAAAKASRPASSSSGSKSGSGGSGNVDGGVWDKIAQCESGGNWSINTGNGYYGGLQFSLATWRSQGGTGLPSEASKSEQIRIATKLQRAAGWGQWSCASIVGVR